MAWSLIRSQEAVRRFLRPAIPAGMRSELISKNVFASTEQCECRKNKSRFQSTPHHQNNYRLSKTANERKKRTMTHEMFPEIETAAEALKARIRITEAEIAEMKHDPQ